MLANRPLYSISSLKRQCSDTETDFVPKKSKLAELNVQKELDVEPTEPRDKRKAKRNIKIVSLILSEQKRNLKIYPSQIVWCRLEKSSFWPAMVWSSKTGKITDDKQRVFVRFFTRKGASVWIKMVNVFPFDGLESFENMKNSVDVDLMTKSMKRDFDFAFNITNDLWPRAVAEAIYCLCKDREDRLSLFIAFSSSSTLRKKRKKPLRRRSHELNISNSCQEKAFRVNDEIHSVQSFIRDISFSKAETSTSSKEVENYEEMLAEFVAESLVSSKFSAGVDQTCNICLTSRSTDSEQLIKCAGICDGYLHQHCFDNRTPQRLGNRDDAGMSIHLICDDCADGSKSLCFVCKAQEDASPSEMVNCKVPNCWRLYHVNCLKNWPPAKWNASNEDLNLICPLHECHQCGAIEGKLTTCIKCPKAVHSDASCIHAGTIILSDSHHICTKHRQRRETTSNLNYCYICEIGNIRSDSHFPHDMCVCFFGDHSFAWIDRQSVHPFDEDNFVVFTETSHKFGEAILSARKWFSQAKSIKMRKRTELAASIDGLTIATQTYTNIAENIPIPPAELFSDSNNEASSCRCIVYDDPCGVTSSCLNRASYTECNDLCPSADECGNKCIQLGKYPKVKLQYFGNKGYGLVSSEWIHCGAIVQQYTGEVITASEYVRRIRDGSRSNIYFMKYTKNLFIDAETKGSVARFINHSCNPNCQFHLWSVNGVNVVVIVALEDIPVDTEITCKYDWSRNIPCLCNEDNCSGFC